MIAGGLKGILRDFLYLELDVEGIWLLKSLLFPNLLIKGNRLTQNWLISQKGKPQWMSYILVLPVSIKMMALLQVVCVTVATIIRIKWSLIL